MIVGLDDISKKSIGLLRQLIRYD